MPFIKGHTRNTGTNNPMYGKHLSEESKIKLRIKATGRKHSIKTIHNMTGENHWHWKGDDVGYRRLHRWVSQYLKKPELCPICNMNKKLEVCNISGKYLRDLNDWCWLCRQCHRIFDIYIKYEDHIQ